VLVEQGIYYPGKANQRILYDILLDRAVGRDVIIILS